MFSTCLLIIYILKKFLMDNNHKQFNCSKGSKNIRNATILLDVARVEKTEIKTTAGE